MTVRAHNNDRYDRLKEYYKIVANEYALKQFEKHPKDRIKPSEILDFIEFSSK